MVEANTPFTQELKELRREAGMLQVEKCSREENKEYVSITNKGEDLPEGVYQYMSDGQPVEEFYRLYEENLSEAERLEYLLLKQYKNLKTIKNCVVFFTTFTILAIIIYFCNTLN